MALFGRKCLAQKNDLSVYLLCYGGMSVTVRLNQEQTRTYRTITIFVSDVMPHSEEEEVNQFYAKLRRDIPVGHSAVFEHHHEGMYRFDGYSRDIGDLHFGPKGHAREA